jgi:hypothetical protein
VRHDPVAAGGHFARNLGVAPLVRHEQLSVLQRTEPREYEQREKAGDDWTPKPTQDRQGVRHDRNDPGHFSATAGDASVRSASKM